MSDHDEPVDDTIDGAIDDTIDAQERREAEALARALEGRRPLDRALDGSGSDSADDPAHDAMDHAQETAALLRYAGTQGELDGARGDHILEALLAQAPPAAAPPARPWVGLLRWLPLPLAAAAAIGLFLYMGAPGQQRESSAADESAGTADARVAEPALPAPSAKLLAAQAAASKGGDGRRALEREMREYRERMLRRLEARYPTSVGQLDDRLRWAR